MGKAHFRDEYGWSKIAQAAVEPGLLGGARAGSGPSLDATNAAVGGTGACYR